MLETTSIRSCLVHLVQERPYQLTILNLKNSSDQSKWDKNDRHPKIPSPNTQGLGPHAPAQHHPPFVELDSRAGRRQGERAGDWQVGPESEGHARAPPTSSPWRPPRRSGRHVARDLSSPSQTRSDRNPGAVAGQTERQSKACRPPRRAEESRKFPKPLRTSRLSPSSYRFSRAVINSIDRARPVSPAWLVVDCGEERLLWVWRWRRWPRLCLWHPRRRRRRGSRGWRYTRSAGTTSAPRTPPPCPAASRRWPTARSASRPTSRRTGSGPASTASSWLSCSITRTCCCSKSGTPPSCCRAAASGPARKISKGSSASFRASCQLASARMPLKTWMTGRWGSALGCGGGLNSRPFRFHTCLQTFARQRNASSCS